LLAWVITQTPPWAVADEMVKVLTYVVDRTGGMKGFGYGPIEVLVDMGVPKKVAVIGTAVCLLGLLGWALNRYRRAETLVLFGITALISQWWTHHKAYDELIVLLFVLAFASQLLRQGRTYWTIPVLLIIQATLIRWRLHEFVGFEGVVVIQIIVWSAAFAGLIWMLERRADLSVPGNRDPADQADAGDPDEAIDPQVGDESKDPDPSTSNLPGNTAI